MNDSLGDTGAGRDCNLLAGTSSLPYLTHFFGQSSSPDMHLYLQQKYFSNFVEVLFADLWADNTAYAPFLCHQVFSHADIPHQTAWMPHSAIYHSEQYPHPQKSLSGPEVAETNPVPYPTPAFLHSNPPKLLCARACH